MKKKMLCLFMTVIVIFTSVLCVSASTIEVADTGKTVITIGDWVYESIEGGKYWELDKYIGEGGTIYIPRIVNDTMVISIGSHCFVDNDNVKKVITSSPLRSVNDYAFLNCTSLKEFDCDPSIIQIGLGAFSGCTSLNSINLEDSNIVVVRPNAFMSSGITEVTLPDTCTEIMQDAFAQCPDLVKLVIPRSVTVIGDDAFARSDNLVIYCYTDSAAHQYAVANNIPFVLLDAEPKGYLLGDTDNNDDVEVIDATWLQRYVALMDIGVIEDTVMQGDVDGDGDPSVVDATFIMRYCVGISTPYDIGEIVTDN